MIIPLIVIGVLFLITWIVIGVATTDDDEKCKHHCQSGLEPFHICETTRLQGEVQQLRSELGSLRYAVRGLESDKRYSHPVPDPIIESMKALKTPEELFEELMGKDKTLKVEATVRLKK